MADSITIEELKTRLETGSDFLLLDVRRKDDYHASPKTIENAEWHDPATIADWGDSIPKQKEVIVYCVKGGPVSQSVADQLLSRQCNVKFLEGGIKAWSEMQHKHP